MNWAVDHTPEFGAWFEQLSQRDQDAVADKVNLLALAGPALGRPHVDTVRGSRFRNMKELRVKRRQIRVFFAFDPRRSAVLLIGGAKAGRNRFYKSLVPRADALYDEHLRRISDHQPG